MCAFLRHKTALTDAFSVVVRRNFIYLNRLRCKPKGSAGCTNFVRSFYSSKDCKYCFMTTSEDDDIRFNENKYRALENVRFKLLRDITDPNVVSLSNCASVEEVFSFLKSKSEALTDEYLTQAVLVLYDLQIIYRQVCDIHNNETKQGFIKGLLENSSFKDLLISIKVNLKDYNPRLLGYTAVYLNKLGVSVENDVMQSICWKLRNQVNNEFTLELAQNFFRVIFSEHSVRPYYLSIDVIPAVLNEISSCNNVEDLQHLTVCLNKLNFIVSDNHLEQYKCRIYSLINSNILSGKDYLVILKILLFLNYPHWRNKNVQLISDCILLMKDHIMALNINELEILYDVFFKNQEPGDVLNSIQRCSAQHLQEMDDVSPSQTDSKLKLFSCLMYFSAPTHRMQFRKDIEKYLDQCDNYYTLFIIKQIFSYLKISDRNLCKYYWDKILKNLKQDLNADNILILIDKYMNFNANVDNYRHFGFEKAAVNFLKGQLYDGSITLYPNKFFVMFSFALTNEKCFPIMEDLMDRFRRIQIQMTPIDCLRISQSIQVYPEDVNRNRENTINILNNATKRIFQRNNDFIMNIILAKAAILRNDTNSDTFEDLLNSFKEIPYMSSKIIESLTYIFLSTGILIPEVLNKCTEYVIHNKKNVVGFNAEKLLYLCYFLNYYPVNPGKFFTAVTDIIIRDQERMSGLAFIQSVLALCYFNLHSKALIKQIFNVEFLDKLDIELTNCYSKDVYPQRVRKVLMQLNRVVCLEYPEYQVPWFHQKYVEDTYKHVRDDVKHFYHLRVRDYLVGVLGTEGILENVTTPYGYFLNFVVHLDENNRPTAQTDHASTAKLALLLLNETHYTRYYTHLKGRHQSKLKHLEILGYKVKIIKLEEWLSLLYAKERIEFIRKTVFQ